MTAVVPGTPEITGGVLLLTVIENAARRVVAMPSVTLMPMSLNVPTLPLPGVPASRPVAASNVAQTGLLRTVKRSVLPSASAAVGRNT